MSQQEKIEKESSKKKELEGYAKQARDDYMRKMQSVSIANSSG